MLADLKIYSSVDCFDLCDILRLKLTTYHDAPFNYHVMNDGRNFSAVFANDRNNYNYRRCITIYY